MAHTHLIQAAILVSHRGQRWWCMPLIPALERNGRWERQVSVDSWRHDCPFWSEADVSATMYDTQGAWTLMLAPDCPPQDILYELVKWACSLFESLLVLASFHSKVTRSAFWNCARETEYVMLFMTQMISNWDCAQFSQLVDWVPMELNLKSN